MWLVLRQQMLFLALSSSWVAASNVYYTCCWPSRWGSCALLCTVCVQSLGLVLHGLLPCEESCCNWWRHSYHGKTSVSIRSRQMDKKNKKPQFQVYLTFVSLVNVIWEIWFVYPESPRVTQGSQMLAEMMSAAMWSLISDRHWVGRQGEAFPQLWRTPWANRWASWHAEMGERPQRHRYCHLGGSSQCNSSNVWYSYWIQCWIYSLQTTFESAPATWCLDNKNSAPLGTGSWNQIPRHSSHLLKSAAYQTR